MAFKLASNEVKIVGHKRKVDLLPMKTCDESSFATQDAQSHKPCEVRKNLHQLVIY